MKLEQFIQTILATPTDVFNHRVIVMYGSEYPLLLMSQLVKIISAHNVGRVIPLDLQQETSVIHAQLQTTFLGSSSLYWLADSLNQSSRANQKELLNYIQHYQGPNTIFLFLTGQQPRNVPETWSVIWMADEISKDLLNAIVTLYQRQGMGKIDQQFIRQLFSMSQQLTIDQLCLLLQYASITAGGAKEFFTEWVPQLISPEQSLFTLSQHLFSRKATSFFNQWSHIKDNYMGPFWISFWSEQLWRAACFIEYAKAGDTVEAKKMSYKLPFSFIQRDWKYHSAQELKAAHELLYDLDGKVKNGGDAVFLEYFYVSFFKR